MLDAFKKLISRPAPGPEWREVVEWAKHNKLKYKREAEGEGFVQAIGIERPGVPDPAFTQRPPCHADDVVRRHPCGLVDEQQAVRACDVLSATRHQDSRSLRSSSRSSDSSMKRLL